MSVRTSTLAGSSASGSGLRSSARATSGAGAHPGHQRVDRREHDRVERDGDERGGQDEAAALSWQQLELDAQARKDEGELADLGEPGADRERGVDRIAQGQDQRDRGGGLAEHDDRDRRRQLERLSDHYRRIEEHPHRHEEQHGKRVAERERFLRGPVAQGRLPEHHAGEECAERERDAEQLRRSVGHADRRGDDGEGEQLAGAGAGHQPEHAWAAPGDRRPASAPRTPRPCRG